MSRREGERTSVWPEVLDLLTEATNPGYGRDLDGARRTATEKLRRIILDTERKADERETLRDLLIDEGIKNAQLTVENYQLQTKLDAMRAEVEDLRDQNAGTEPV